MLDRKPSMRAALAAGALSGVLILVKPSALHIMVAVVAAVWIAWGSRAALPKAAAATAACVLVVVPWTVRNYAEFDSFVPLSFQDASSLYGVFNEEAASDPRFPYAWRANTSRDGALFRELHLDDDELRAELRDRAFDYIEEHPESVPKAIFWNGLSRFWDIRRPANVLNEVDFQGRSKALTRIGLLIWWILLPLAIAGLWLHRRRRAIVIPLVLMFALSSLVYIANTGTRYRAPFEPIAAILACSAVAVWRDRRTDPRPAVPPGAPPGGPKRNSAAGTG